KVNWKVAQEMDTAGNDEGALQQYEKILAAEPGNPIAMRRLCVLYDRRGAFEKAEPLYKKLAALHPKDADLIADWGYSCYLRAGKENWAEAEKKLRRALELNPGLARAHNNLGMVLGQRERYDDALREFRVAGLSEAQAHCNLAFVYWTKYRLDEA